jgi:hypothetical protein
LVRPAIQPDWEGAVFGILGRQPKASARAIEEALRQVVGDAPSPRTIGRIKERFEALPSERKALYAEVRWPDSMGSHLLPWEASAAVLDLLDALAPRRPDVGLAVWFWRVTQAASDASRDSRIAAARSLYAWDVLGRQFPHEDLEAWMRFAPWRSAEAEERYRDAVERGEAERPIGSPFSEWAVSTGLHDSSKGDMRAALKAMGLDAMGEWAIEGTLKAIRGEQQTGDQS